MIRDAIETDAEGIASIYNHYISNSVATFEEREVSTLDMAERIRAIKESGHSWLVIFEKDILVGYAYSSKWKERTAYKNTAEISVYLSHTFTGKGIGTKLYTLLFSRLRKNNIHIAIGGITLPNQVSISLHEKFGMVKVAHFNEIGFKFDQWLDVGYWQIKLNA